MNPLSKNYRMLRSLIDGPKSAKQISALVDCKPGHVATAMENLVNRGLAEERRTHAGRIRLGYAITDKGRAELRATEEASCTD